MKFKRMERYEDFEWTKRKLAFASNRLNREQSKIDANYPLIADQVAPLTPAFDADNEALARNARIKSSEARMRALYARVWKESRRDFFRATPEQMQAIRDDWRTWRGPLTSMYFRYVVDLHTGVVEQRREAFKQQQMNWRNEVANQPATLPLVF